MTFPTGSYEISRGVWKGAHGVNRVEHQSDWSIFVRLRGRDRFWSKPVGASSDSNRPGLPKRVIRILSAVVRIGVGIYGRNMLPKSEQDGVGAGHGQPLEAGEAGFAPHFLHLSSTEDGSVFSPHQHVEVKQVGEDVSRARG